MEGFGLGAGCSTPSPTILRAAEGASGERTERESEREPESDPEPEPEPVAEAQPEVVPVPVAEPEPEPVAEAQPAVVPVPMTEILTYTDDDHFNFELHGPGPKGKVFKMIEIAYTRQ